MKLSVLVSTHNRAADLARFLDAIAGSTFRNDEIWELVIVANACTDNTLSLLETSQAREDLRLVIVSEPRKGKSRALNTGLEYVSGDIVVFTDDDVVPPSEWLQTILDHFDHCPASAGVGGMVVLHNLLDLPFTINLTDTAFSIDTSSFTPDNSPLMGCNMAFRMSAIKQTDGFDEVLGPGTTIQAAEDLDFLYQIISHGHTLDYRPEVKVAHNHGRRDKREVGRLFDAYAFGRGAFYAKHILKQDMRVARWAYWELRGCLRALPRVLTHRLSRREVENIPKLLTGAISYTLKVVTGKTKQRVISG